MAFTYFFRDKLTMEMIRDFALPNLKGRRYIKIWDAGCAMGPEPYSLAIMLRENMGYMYFRNVKITATDIDGSNLFKGIIEKGIYPREQTERIPAPLLSAYFKQLDGQSYGISDEIRNSVRFRKHDLLTLHPVDTHFGLVLCKNVLLHFSASQRIDVIRMFYDALDDEVGYLAMEQTQKLPEEVKDLFEPVVSNAQLYKKVKGK